MIKYIIFDFDGTLVDSKDVFISAFNQLAKKHHFNEIKLEELDYLQSLTIKERCKYLNFPLYKIPIISSELFQLYKNSLKDIKLMNGISEMLTNLKEKGFKLAIISSNSEKNIQEYLQKNDIDHISSIMTSNRIFGKDRMIDKFLKRNNLKQTEVLYVGDEQRDIVASKKSGVKVIWVGWGYDKFEIIQQENPDFIVHTPGEIIKVAQSI